MGKLKKIESQRKGITLVALVVTVIVLLILAGITINLTIGQDGIMNIAQQAGKNYIEAEKTERNILDVSDNTIKQYIAGASREDYKVTRKNVVENDSFEQEQTKTYDIKKITDKYKTLTTENFAYTCGFYHSVPKFPGVSRTEKLVLDYNSETGILTANATSLVSSGKYILCFADVNIYVFYWYENVI